MGRRRTAAGLGQLQARILLVAIALVIGACGDAEESIDTTAASTTQATTTTAATTTVAAPEAADVTLALGWIKNVEYAGTFVALDRGYFEDNGINLTVNAGGPNAPDPVVAVVSGDADIAMGAGFIQIMQAITEGNDLVMFGAKFQESPAGVLSLAARPVLEPEDLIGIKFLGQPAIPAFLDAVFSINNIEGEYDFIPAGFDPQPLVDGDGEAYSSFLTNQAITLELTHGMVLGEDYFAVSWGELGLPLYSNVLFAERSWLEENRDAAVRFMEALIHGWEDNNAEDPGVGARLAVEVYGVEYGLDLAQQTRQNEVQMPFLISADTEANGLFWINEAYIEGPIFEGLRAAGFTVPDDIASQVDNTIIADALASR